MSSKKINLYKKNGSILGYFSDPKIDKFGDDEYQIKGIFHDAEGGLMDKLEFNPQSLPYWAELQNLPDIQHAQLTNVYIQRNRQPIIITGLGS